MNHKYFFMGGLQRSGSTLLSAILQQNPEIYVSENSPICDLTYKLNQLFDNNYQYNSCPFENRRINVVKSLIDNYYYDVSESIIIDKFRSWGTHYNISMIEALYDQKVKIICPVRSITEILTSWITLFNKNKNHVSYIDKLITEKVENIDDVRCDLLMNMDGGILHQMYAMDLCRNPSFNEVFHIVEYEDLISNPSKEIEKIYDFLKIKKYTHKFNNIKFNAKSRDTDYFGTPGLHEVRKYISKISKDPNDVLSETVLTKYSGLEFWR